MAFSDHFSGHASTYARYRPGYPPELFSWLASMLDRRECGWDCATGNGQAAIGLVEHLTTVIATDASAQQLAEAMPHPRISYRVASAEACGLPDASVDVITVAQALHWFDLERFHQEADRVLRPGGVISAWCYALLRIEPRIDVEINRLYDALAPFWPPQRRLVEDGYRDLSLPGTPLQAPAFHMSARWSLNELCGYVRTWSASQRYQRERGEDPVIGLEERLRPLWPPGEHGIATVQWPLTLLVSRRSA